jgi:hypothetical protein
MIYRERLDGAQARAAAAHDFRKRTAEAT